jgi:GNAT superfamily N-acetyltransferase
MNSAMQLPTIRNLQIRPPVGLESQACRQLLPEVIRQGYWADFAVAVDGPPLRILGALAYTPGVHANGRRGWRVSFRVARPYRRQGIGNALLNYVIDAARRCDLHVIQTCHDPIREPDVDPFLIHRGFQSDDRLSTYQFDAAPLTEFTCTLRDWLIERGEVPADHQLVPLQEPMLEEVAQLHAQYIGGTQATLLAHLKRVINGPTAEDNRVLLVGQQIVGAVLGEIKDGLSRADVTLVKPDYRGGTTQSGWAQAVLLAHSLERAQTLGATRAQFSCLSNNRPMMRLVKRLNAKPVSVEELHLLRLRPLDTSATVEIS